MNLKVVATGSAGNAYILDADDGKLILDAGVRTRQIIEACNGLDNVDGCLITHEHGDHSLSASGLLSYGVSIYATHGTTDVMGMGTSYWHPFWHEVKMLEPVNLKHFTILPFPTEHDAQEPCGFLIRHKATKTNILYVTDTYYLRNTFPNIHHWIVECNYVDKIMEEQAEQGLIERQLMNRLRKSHMSLARLKQTLKANDLSKTVKIILVHLSDGRSNEEQMVTEINQLTGVETIAANAGMVIDLSLTPF